MMKPRTPEELARAIAGMNELAQYAFISRNDRTHQYLVFAETVLQWAAGQENGFSRIIAELATMDQQVINAMIGRPHVQ